MITKETTDFSGADFRSGEVLLIDKPPGWSSFKVIHELRKITGEKKIGHAGTLDPLATGLLIICTGKKTKEITTYQEKQKTYTGIIELGKTSPSMDSETEISSIEIPSGIDFPDIQKAKEALTGKIMQLPPMYSAIKHKGRNLYLLARKGHTVERQPRLVEVFEFEILSFNSPSIHFKITCSKGTYIRVIANDFGQYLGTGAILTNLRRTAIGEYSVGEALTLPEIKAKMVLKEQSG